MSKSTGDNLGFNLNHLLKDWGCSKPNAGLDIPISLSYHSNGIRVMRSVPKQSQASLKCT